MRYNTHEFSNLQLNADNKINIIGSLIEAFKLSDHLGVGGKVLESLANLYLYRRSWSLLGVPLEILSPDVSK